MAETKTDEQIAAENKAADDAATEIADAEASLEEITEKRLEQMVTNQPLEKSAEPDASSEDPTPEEEEEETSAESDEEDDGPTPAEKAAEAKLEAEQAAENEEAAATDEEGKATDEEAGEGKKQEDVPQLSEAYYRAAIHRGWKEEDIKAFCKANPELAITTFGNVYEEVNRSSQEFAKFGQASKEAAAKLAEKPVEPGKQTASEAIAESAIDLKKLRADYPDDPIVDMIAAQEAQNQLMRAELDAMKTVAPANTVVQPSAAEQRAANQESASIQQQIEGFFDGEEAKPYAEFYGAVPKGTTDWKTVLTPGQGANRWAVIEMMDQMIAGAESFGQTMEIAEAMRLAHLSVSEPLREKVIREGIMGKVVKRSGGITLKPSSTAKATDTAPQTEAELLRKTEERLQSIR